MARIFVSYAREDERSAIELASGLKANGHEVWWDHDILPGADYRSQIQAQLDAADKVIVLWSRHSVTSAFVADEATHAQEANKLIPVLLDGTRPPLGHRTLQALSAAQIKADMASLLAAIEGRPGPPPRLSRAARPRPTLLLAIVAVAGLASLGGVLAYGLLPRGCSTNGLEPGFDYRCYRSDPLRLEFVYPQGVLTLDTTREHEMTLRFLNRQKEREVVIKKTPLPDHDIRRAREMELQTLKGMGYDLNLLRPKAGEAWENYYVVSGHKPNKEEFYYKRWHTPSDVVSIEFDYANDKISQYDKIIEVMVKDRFRIK